MGNPSEVLLSTSGGGGYLRNEHNRKKEGKTSSLLRQEGNARTFPVKIGQKEFFLISSSSSFRQGRRRGSIFPSSSSSIFYPPPLADSPSDRLMMGSFWGNWLLRRDWRFRNLFPSWAAAFGGGWVGVSWVITLPLPPDTIFSILSWIYHTVSLEIICNVTVLLHFCYYDQDLPLGQTRKICATQDIHLPSNSRVFFIFSKWAKYFPPFSPAPFNCWVNCESRNRKRYCGKHVEKRKLFFLASAINLSIVI